MSENIWLYVIGIGEEGICELTSSARKHIYEADIFYGGKRHFEHLYNFDKKLKEVESYFWHKPFMDNIEKIKSYKLQGKKIVVLASGNPLFYGAGSVLADHISNDEMLIIPHISSVDIACARLCWPLNDVNVVTIHGRPVERILANLAPKQRIIILCNDGNSPKEIAKLLSENGYRNSKITALSNLGGEHEVIYSNIAYNWGEHKSPDLTIAAIELEAEVISHLSSSIAGIEDEVYESDGNFTKREVRAITLSSLRPANGHVLWDVGSGSGTIAIEWMRACKDAKVYAIEMNEKRIDYIRSNSLKLGAAGLNIMHGRAPYIFSKIDKFPDAIFIGGGLSNFDIIEKAYKMLLKGGRMAANAVTIEGCNNLIKAQEIYGGEIVRISIEKLQNVSSAKMFRPNVTVMHWRLIKD